MSQQQQGGTLIELLVRQQDGIKLALHNNLLERMELGRLPFHHCASTNNLPLALHLVLRGVRPCALGGHQVYLATFTAQGVAGETPWQKPLIATPSDVARLAGHGRLAAVLDHLEAGVPLHWHPQAHQSLPQAARRKVQEVARALCSSGWFIRLPGTARQAVMLAAANDVCRSTAWSMVEPEEWLRAEQGDFGDLSATIERLVQDHAGFDVSSHSGGAPRSGGPGSGAIQRASAAHSTTASAAAAGAGTQPLARGGAGGGGDGPSQSDLVARQHEQLLASLVDPLRSFSFRMAFVPNTGGEGQAALGPNGQGGDAPERRRGRWWRLLLGGAVPLAAIVVMTSDCRKLKREHLATYLAGTLAGLQLPGVIILVAKLLAGN